MNNESARLMLARGKAPARISDDETLGAETQHACPGPCSCQKNANGETNWKLRRDGDKVLFVPDVGEEVPARLLWTRPLSQRGGEVSVLMAEKKTELAFISDINCLDPESQAIAREELGHNLVLPRITKILNLESRFGNYYWTVETDKGPAKFIFSSPEANSFESGPDAVVLKDTAGNCFEINPLSQLDSASRRLFGLVL